MPKKNTSRLSNVNVSYFLTPCMMGYLWSGVLVRQKPCWAQRNQENNWQIKFFFLKENKEKEKKKIGEATGSYRQPDRLKARLVKLIFQRKIRTTVNLLPWKHPPQFTDDRLTGCTQTTKLVHTASFCIGELKPLMLHRFPVYLLMTCQPVYTLSRCSSHLPRSR